MHHVPGRHLVLTVPPLQLAHGYCFLHDDIGLLEKEYAIFPWAEASRNRGKQPMQSFRAFHEVAVPDDLQTFLEPLLVQRRHLCQKQASPVQYCLNALDSHGNPFMESTQWIPIVHSSFTEKRSSSEAPVEFCSVGMSLGSHFHCPRILNLNWKLFRYN